MFPGGVTLLEAATATNATVAAGSKLTLTPTRPIAIIRWGFICNTTVNDGANALKLTLDFYTLPNAGGTHVTGATTLLSAQTGWNASTLPGFYTDLAGGTITLVASTTQVVAGKGIYHQINPQTKMPPTDASTNPVPSPDTAFVSGGGAASLGLTVYPGQEVQLFSVATAPGAGNGQYFIHYYPLGFQGSGSNYENVATGIPASITPVVGDPGIWSRVLT